MSAVLALFLFAFSFSIHAQVAPVITRVDGQVPTAVYADGREAEFRVSRGLPFTAPIPFKVSENACAPGVNGAEFNSIFPMQLDRVAWFWTKHTDPAKIGQILTYGGPGPGMALFSFAFITQVTKGKFPDLAPNLPRNEYVFDDLSWFPGMENGLKDFTIEAWTAEVMLPNSQTGLNENRIVSGAENARFVKTGEKTMVLEGAEQIYTLSVGELDAFATLGDVVNWKWRVNGQPCLISFKPNLGKLNATITEKLGNMTDPFTPYLHNSDSLEKAILPLFTDASLTYAQ